MLKITSPRNDSTGDRVLCSRGDLSHARTNVPASRETPVTRRGRKEHTARGRRCAPSILDYSRSAGCFRRKGQYFWVIWERRLREEKKRKEKKKKKTEKGPCRVCPASLDDFAGSRKISSAFERRGRGGGGEGEGEERKSNVAISLIFQGIREWVLRGSRFLKISLITSTRHVKPPWRRVFALRSHEVRRAFFCCPSTTGLPILAAFDSAE